MGKHELKTSEQLGTELLDDGDRGTAYGELAAMAHRLGDEMIDAPGDHAKAVAVLAARFLKSRIEDSLYQASSPDPEAVGFMAYVGQNMAFERDVVEQEAAKLAALIRGLIEQGVLLRDFKLLDTAGEDLKTATREFGIILETISALGLADALEGVQGVEIDRDGQKGTGMSIDMGAGYNLVYNELTIHGDREASVELVLTTNPVE